MKTKSTPWNFEKGDKVVIIRKGDERIPLFEAVGKESVGILVISTPLPQKPEKK